MMTDKNTKTDLPTLDVPVANKSTKREREDAWSGKLVKKRKTISDAVILGFMGKENETKQISFVTFSRDNQVNQLLEVYPRGQDDQCFSLQYLDEQQNDLLSTIRELLRISLSSLKYVNKAWKDSVEWQPKQEEIERLSSSPEMQLVFGWKGSNMFSEIRTSFIKGMFNSYGRTAVYHILDLAVGLLPNKNRLHNMNVGGSNAQYEGSFLVNSIDLDENLDPEDDDSPLTSQIKKTKLVLTMNSAEPFKKERKIPDGQVFIEEETGISILLSAVVSPDKESNDDSLYQKTWIQSVGGLIKRDFTHGVAMTCRGGQLIKLAKDSEKGCIKTTVEYFDFKRPDKSFNFERFWSFFLGLVGILEKG